MVQPGSKPKPTAVNFTKEQTKALDEMVTIATRQAFEQAVALCEFNAWWKAAAAIRAFAKEKPDAS